MAPVPRQLPAPEHDTLAHAMRRIGLAEDDLPDFLDGLMAAYQDAVAFDDDAAIAVLGKALKTVGWHLANDLGPRKAGVTLN